MNILLIGAGGREHALAWKISQSPLLGKLYCAPGNAGISKVAECVKLNFNNHAEVISFCREHNVQLVVIGPEEPLVNGLSDGLEDAQIKVFGCNKAAAALEGSKAFMKNLCRKYNIPTAAYQEFSELSAAESYIRQVGAPIVVKADGLAAGKGVVVATTTEEALTAAAEIMSGKFGAAGNKLVIEEFLEGSEASFFALADGITVRELGSAQDHKRAFDGDCGPNTGGMGTISPTPNVTPEISETVMREIITPTLEALKAEGISYKGILFAGLMLTKTGPKLLEYNCRFGDPETQVLMRRFRGDILPLLLAVASGNLADSEIQMNKEAAVCVVMATRGYPGDYVKGSIIGNLAAAGALQDVEIFHAGTGFNDSGDLVATGGRVLGVTATGASLEEARRKAYQAVDSINWPEGFYRTDIGAVKKHG
jgi:phosphoribosylamine--glycine ligase